MKADMYLREIDSQMRECNQKAQRHRIDEPEFLYYTGRLSALQSCKDLYLSIRCGTPLQASS